MFVSPFSPHAAEMMHGGAGQGSFKASGTVLARSRIGEGGLQLTLFLKGIGMTRMLAPGAESESKSGGRTRGAKVRFGGATEPFMWCVFQLHRGRNGGLYLSGADAADDMLPMRRRPEALLTAVRWSKLLMKLLPFEQPDDELAANLYWNMRLLCCDGLKVDAADWRFMYRWLMLWGLAPDLSRCSACCAAADELYWADDGLLCPRCIGRDENRPPSFSAGELRMLAAVQRISSESLAELASGRYDGDGASLMNAVNRSSNVFKAASRCCSRTLNIIKN